MLVATPGQAAAYAIHNSANPSASKKTCHTSSATPKTNAITTTNGTAIASVAHNNNTTVNKHRTVSAIVAPPLNAKLSESPSTGILPYSAANAFIKTLSVRLNRGTEFLKGTVQRALISASSGRHNNNNNNNNNNNKSSSSRDDTSTNNASASNCSDGSAITNIATTVASSSAVSTAVTAAVHRKYRNSTFLKLYTIAPTTTHRCPNERQNASSVDSLHKEMCHFKPIRTVPTTPWKCGTKSRGNKLRAPKACFATKTEISLKPNCDAANSLHDNIEVDCYNTLKPNPDSNLLTTIFSSPTHQSAFVCLVAQMKSLVNVQSKRATTVSVSASTSAKRKKRSRKTRSSGRRIKGSSVMRLATPNSARASFVQMAKLDIPTELIMTRSKGKMVRNRSRAKVSSTKSSAAGAAKTVGKTPPLAKRNVGSVTKARSRATMNRNTSRIVNIVALAQEKNAKAPTATGIKAAEVKNKRSLRKRRATDEVNGEQVTGPGPGPGPGLVTASAMAQMQPGLRKSARLSKDYSAASIELIPQTETKDKAQNVMMSKRQMQKRNKGIPDGYTPPLTRARLKQMTNGKLNAALEFKRRI